MADVFNKNHLQEMLDTPFMAYQSIKKAPTT